MYVCCIPCPLSPFSHTKSALLSQLQVLLKESFALKQQNQWRSTQYIFFCSNHENVTIMEVSFFSWWNLFLNSVLVLGLCLLYHFPCSFLLFHGCCSSYCLHGLLASWRILLHWKYIVIQESMGCFYFKLTCNHLPLSFPSYLLPDWPTNLSSCLATYLHVDVAK